MSFASISWVEIASALCQFSPSYTRLRSCFSRFLVNMANEIGLFDKLNTFIRKLWDLVARGDGESNDSLSAYSVAHDFMQRFVGTKLEMVSIVISMVHSIRVWRIYLCGCSFD